MNTNYKENQMQQATTAVGKPQLCYWKTNRKSLSQTRFPVKTLLDSLKQLFPNKCGVWLQWDFCYWDVVERGPRSELSSYWARQTAAWSRGGGIGGGGGAHPCLPHTPHHPTPRCHFTSDLILSPHPSFMFTLTSFPLCHPSLGRRCSIIADTKHLNVQVTFCFLPFSRSLPWLLESLSLYLTVHIFITMFTLQKIYFFQQILKYNSISYGSYHCRLHVNVHILTGKINQQHKGCFVFTPLCNLNLFGNVAWGQASHSNVL